MRLILFMLAVANLRWARAEIDRSEQLYAEGDAAFASAERRFALAQTQVQRSRFLRA